MFDMQIQVIKNYTAKWELKELPNYKITECNNVINSKTGKLLKQCVIGYSKGYWINKKFVSLQYLRNNCRKIEKIDMPF